jgi:DNA-directed RNA polymerase specialized sigma24 family protein
MNDALRSYPAGQDEIETNEKILESIDGYIVIQARRLIYRVHTSNYREASDLEVDELAQRARIKLWHMLNKGMIHRPYPYVRRIIYSEFIDMKRQQKPVQPLILDDEGGCQSLAIGDPADEVIQHFEDFALLQHIVQMVVDLPPRQQLAMVCFLREVVDDPAQLSIAFYRHHIDITGLQWPSQIAERQLLRASLTVARRKLARRWLMTVRS